ncbi:MAG: hypothetical protein ACTHLZ_03110, partial [Tepidisphaeraceae bacterium]
MSILFVCTGCGAKYNVPETLGGKKAQCKKCGVVTRIPKPTPTPSEGDVLSFRDEPSPSSEPSLNAETVAGTVHAMDTGRRVLGESAFEPPETYETDDGPRPLMSALPKVAASELDALDFKAPPSAGGAGRGAVSGNYAPDERYSMLLMLLFVLAVGFGIYHDYTTWPAMLSSVKPEYATLAGPPHAMLVLPRLIMLFCGFAVLAPLMMIAWLGACKIANVRLPSNIYTRALGLAVLPAAMIILLTSLPLDMTPATAGTLSVVCIPIAFVLLAYVHRQSMMISGIATGAASVLLAFGLILMFFGADAVQASMRTAYEQKRDVLIAQKVAEKQQHDLALQEEKREKEKLAKAAASQPSVPSATVAKQADDLLARLTKLQDKASLADQTRESLGRTLDAADAELAADKKLYADLPAYAPVTEAIAALRQTAAGLPSENPPADLAQAPAPGPDWSAKSARREVSVFGDNLVPPADGIVVLNTDPSVNAWTWKSPDRQAQLTIAATPATGDQQRPWVAPASITQRVKTPVFTIDAAPDAKVDTGSINGQPFTRITQSPAPGTAGVQKVTYVTRTNDQWLSATIESNGQNPTAVEDMERSVGTLHKRPAGVAAVDPLSATELVSRYRSAHGTEADAIARLLKGKPDAEDAVLRAIGVTPDVTALQQFGPLLASVATPHAVPTLWKIAPLEGPASDAARAALRTLDPKNSDDLSFAVMDLKSGRPELMKHAIAVLAKADVQKSRLYEVGRALQVAMADHGFVLSNAGPDLVTALGKWMNEEIGRGLVKMLDSDNSADRQFAIKALGATGGRRYAYSICRAVTREPDTVVDTLIAMGPV